MSAVISDCGRYRYWLERRIDGVQGKAPGNCVFIMLNPSTADAELDDPTIRRCKGFAQRFGCNRLVVVNVFAFRATKPADLYKAKDPVGPENDDYILKALALPGIKFCAWGANNVFSRDETIARFAARRKDVALLCLGKTKNGSPRHPLYIAADAPFEVW
jgi:hypothetical protein